MERIIATKMKWLEKLTVINIKVKTKTKTKTKTQIIMINKQTVFLKSPKRSRVKPRSSGSCVCDELFPIFLYSYLFGLLFLND